MLESKPFVYAAQVDEEEVKTVVTEAFAQRFGRGFVKDLFIGKYPENYEVVVYVRDKGDLKSLLELSHRLSDAFYAQGLPIAISTRKVGRSKVGSSTLRL